MIETPATSTYQKLIEASNLAYDVDRDRFKIVIPKSANIGYEILGRHADSPKSDAIAIIYEDDGEVSKHTYGELHQQALQFAVHLSNLGVQQGTTVAVHTGQRPETIIAHAAIYYLGAIVLTLSQLYGPDTIEHILTHSNCRFIVTDDDSWKPLRPHRKRFKTLDHCILVSGNLQNELSFIDMTRGANTTPFKRVETEADDPALLMYTSGSTGMPKGMLHGHRIVHAYYPTLTMFFNLELARPGAVFWTPADWAWVGGLLDLAIPALQSGQTVVASNHRFSAEWAFEFMARHYVTHSFMTPTALKRLAEIPNPRRQWNLDLSIVCTGGESLPSEVVRWSEKQMQLVCNEFYGLTEFNHMIGNCAALYPVRPGSMGRALPGRTVAIIDESGDIQPDGTVGEIASLRKDEQTLFLGYWGSEDLPEKMTRGEWLLSGDLAYKDKDGYFWYQGRNDDLIKSSGYRIGPAEVEDTLVRHPMVVEAAVVGKPDIERGQIVCAFVRLAKNATPSEELKKQLQSYVKTNLAYYKYPRTIYFVESFPLTNSGKIRRKDLRARVIAE